MKRSSLSTNVIANYVGTAWSSILQILLVPIYLALLGVEQWGLIGVSATLQAVLAVLDLGLSPAINRELARRSALGTSDEQAGDLVRTLEIIYWAVAIVLGGAIIVASPWLASGWINVKAIPVEEVRVAIALMGLMVALQWPVSMYGGGLLGLERQALFTGVTAATNTLAACGAVLILVFVSRTTHAFFLWRAVTSLVSVLVLRQLLWRSLRPLVSHKKPRFRLETLSSIWRFSLGMAGITVGAIVLVHADKLIVMRLLSLETYGYYMVAASAATMLPQLVMPIYTAAFPRLSHVVATKDREAERTQFHVCAQLVTVVQCPAVAVLILFSHDVVLLWTGNAVVASACGAVLSLLSIGAILNGATSMLTALQLANGWTRLGLYLNLSLAVLMVSAGTIATRYQGMTGTAWTWIFINFFLFSIGAPLTFGRLLSGEGWRWFRRDLLGPIACIFACAAAVRWILPDQSVKLYIAAKLAVAFTLSYVAALLAAPDVRRNVFAFLKLLRQGTPINATATANKAQSAISSASTPP